MQLIALLALIVVLTFLLLAVRERWQQREALRARLHQTAHPRGR